MKLTDKKPTEPGWYWCSFGWNHIVRVEEQYGKLHWMELGADVNEYGNLEEYTTAMYVGLVDCQWSKKLKEPK